MTKLNKLQNKYWKNLNEIVLFGFGRQGRKVYETLKKDFNIVAIVDNSQEKQGEKIEDKIILSFEQAREYLHQYKVIITTAQYNYWPIRDQMNAEGLVENVDYVMYQQFITEWYYKHKNKIYILRNDISLTSKCTLNCENCIQFLPYWKPELKREIPLEEIKESLQLYFQCVDYVFNIDIVGGEPFLYSGINELVSFIGENYWDRIGYIGFTTSGMIVPKVETLELLKKYSIGVSISDYSSYIAYNHHIPEIVDKLKDYGIYYLWNKNIEWFDFGFPKDKYYYDGEAAVAHMECCNPICHILDDKKLFYCVAEWGAQKGGLYPIEEKAYVDLEKIVNGAIDRKELLELVMGNIEGGYMEFCKRCGGFGEDNDNGVWAARQIKGSISTI